jgi:L-ribulose-5-phosphate 4-epimerase
MLQLLREQVLEAGTGSKKPAFGNVNGISREEGPVVIKPSGVPYEQAKPERLVVTDLAGKIVEGKLRPSSDLPPPLVPYTQYGEVGGVAHMHSAYATATHVDYSHRPVPVTSEMTDQEIAEDYEKSTGRAIVGSLLETNPSATPGALVANHGPFAWGEDAGAAAHNAVILEAIARIAYFTVGINAAAQPVRSALHNKHYLRKRGRNANYGQTKDQP